MVSLYALGWLSPVAVMSGVQRESCRGIFSARSSLGRLQEADFQMHRMEKVSVSLPLPPPEITDHEDLC